MSATIWEVIQDGAFLKVIHPDGHTVVYARWANGKVSDVDFLRESDRKSNRTRQKAIDVLLAWQKSR